MSPSYGEDALAGQQVRVQTYEPLGYGEILFGLVAGEKRAFECQRTFVGLLAVQASVSIAFS